MTTPFRIRFEMVALLLRHHPALDGQPPRRRQQVLVGRAGEGLPRYSKVCTNWRKLSICRR
jgi:hypothetical protein